MVKFCKACGAELEEGSVFCNECGTKAGANAPQTNNDPLFRSYGINMMGGEVVIRHSQIHPGCLIPPGVVIALGIAQGLVNFMVLANYGYFDFQYAFLGFFNLFTIVGLVWLLVRFIAYSTNDLILTNKRVFGKCGLISTTQMQSPLNKIDSVSFKNGLIGKIIGYGTVRIATTSSTFKFRFVREGQSLYNDIFNQLEISETEKMNENAKAIVDAMDEKLS